MRVYSAEETRDLLPFGALIEALREMFRTGAAAPLRHHHGIALEGLPEATLLLMPAWNPAGLGGVKIVNVNPGNAAAGMPALSSSYLLFDARTGRHLAMLDGGEITNRRTAAAAALAASYLARADARRLLVVGAGRVARNLAEAFRARAPDRGRHGLGHRCGLGRAVGGEAERRGLPRRGRGRPRGCGRGRRHRKLRNAGDRSAGRGAPGSGRASTST